MIGPACVAWAVARREFSSFFRIPLGWIIIAVFALFAAAIFCSMTLRTGQVATMRAVFAWAGWLLWPLVPAVSMRLLAEEYRTGTIEPLMTSPAGDYAVVVGKFAGAMAFVACLIAPTLVLVGVLATFSSPAPDAGPILAGYLAILLTGSLYLSLGLLASSMTNNQTLAYLLAFFGILGVLTLPQIALSAVPPQPSWDWARTTLAALNVNARIVDFARGVIDLSHVVFFVTTSLVLVLLAGVALESRRWR